MREEDIPRNPETLKLNIGTVCFSLLKNVRFSIRNSEQCSKLFTVFVSGASADLVALRLHDALVGIPASIGSGPRALLQEGPEDYQ